MNRRGFTLIELLGIVIVMGIILLVVFPNVGNSLKQAEDNKYKSFIDNLSMACETYVSMNLSKFPELDDGEVVHVTIDTLIHEGLVKGNVVDPSTNETVSVNNYMCVSKQYDGTLGYVYMCDI